MKFLPVHLPLTTLREIVITFHIEYIFKMVEWVVIIYDKPGSDRSTCSEEHFAGIPPLVEQGKIVCGGALYNEPTTPGAEPTSAGSHLQVVADTKEEVLELIHKDIFAKNGIWDLENIIIYRFGCAVRQPMN